MLQVISALEGFAIEASDGRLGTVVDFLFDDSLWRVRWLVVECGSWLKKRKVLIHPSALLSTKFEDQQLVVKLTMAEVDGSPDWSEDRPVSQQMETRIFDHYGWDPLWGAPNFEGIPGAMASPLMAPAYFGLRESDRIDPNVELGDSHLRSFAEIVGYRLHTADGDIGHVENLMIEDSDWSLRYFIVDTSNWWFGARVLISPAAVSAIEWSVRHIQLNVTREQVKSSPPWDPMVAFNKNYAKRLHHHYGWPGSES